MCVNCIRSQVDITEGIQKQVTILWCKECNRYLQPPKNWIRAELESKELLTFCVKRMKGLQKVSVLTLLYLLTSCSLQVQSPGANAHPWYTCTSVTGAISTPQHETHLLSSLSYLMSMSHFVSRLT